MALMSFLSRSHIQASMVLTRADHLFIPDYIRQLLHIIIDLFDGSGRGSNTRPTACVSDALAD